MVDISPWKERIGQEVGVTDWIVIDQEKIDLHARNTGDDGWIHTDPERARRETDFGGTIAQGFLLMSHLTEMAKSLALPREGIAYRMNYGFDRLRIIRPVPAGARVRGRFRLASLEEKGDGALLAKLDAAIELEGHDRPAVVAEWLAYLKLLS